MISGKLKFKRTEKTGLGRSPRVGA